MQKFTVRYELTGGLEQRDTVEATDLDDAIRQVRSGLERDPLVIQRGDSADILPLAHIVRASVSSAQETRKWAGLRDRGDREGLLPEEK